MRRPTQLPDERLRQGLAKASPDIIYRTVIEDSGIDQKLIESKSRKQKIAITRQLVYYFLSVDEERPFEDIGILFNQDHATAINGRNAIENWIVSSRYMKLKVIRMATKIIKLSTSKKVQIVGKITGLDRETYELNFSKSEAKLMDDGYVVINPTKIVKPDAAYHEAMRICLRSLTEVDAVALQPDWEDSLGARIEYQVAQALNLKVITL